VVPSQPTTDIAINNTQKPECEMRLATIRQLGKQARDAGVESSDVASSGIHAFEATNPLGQRRAP
jgi:hypothetical protein